MKYRIGSFNMKNFGLSSNKDLQKLAEIILGENFDIVALQEVLSEGKKLEDLIHELHGWEFCFAQPHEPKDSEKELDLAQHDKRGEGYAYIWNAKKFKLCEFTKLGKDKKFEPRIINSMSNDVKADCSCLVRAPYYIRLQPLSGGFFELRLINIHIYFGNSTKKAIDKRKIEYNLLTKEIYPSLSKSRYGQFRPAYTVAMGDYNLNLYGSAVSSQACIPSEVYSYEMNIKTVQNQLTTLKTPNSIDSSGADSGYASNYDHFTYSPDVSNFKSVQFDRVDAVKKYCNNDFSEYWSNISDHLPIIMTIRI